MIKKIAVTVMLVILAGSSIYFYSKYKETKKDSGVVVAAENKKLLEKVSKIIELDNSEEPVIATVTDMTKLAGQPFFAKAKLGDKVLVYSGSKKAIIYRPEVNKIIEVGALVVSVTPTEAVKKELKVFLYNGTGVKGITSKVEEVIKKEMPLAVIVDRENARKRDYKKTLVVDLSKKNGEMAAKLAEVLKAEVVELPAGEDEPLNSEVLVIVGEDRS